MPSFFASGPSDTPIDLCDRQLALLHAATPARRASLALSLSASVVSLSRRALAERMPDAPKRDVAIRFVELNYGTELARALRRCLDSRHP